tara:strand:- start:1657 stop:2250 length:594 start_codon:yes stop_codon:yes gene_type:complete
VDQKRWCNCQKLVAKYGEGVFDIKTPISSPKPVTVIQSTKIKAKLKDPISRSLGPYSTNVINVKVGHIRDGKVVRDEKDNIIYTLQFKKYSNLKAWTEDEDNVYIGRRGVVFIKKADGSKERYPKQDSIFANPFKLQKGLTRKDVIIKYEAYIREQLKEKPELVEQLRGLKGKNLGCWCKPEPCHGDILAKIIDELN